MDRGTVARIEDWDASPLSGGYTDLHRLADSGFSGAVTAAGTWLFMLNGRAIGVVDGTVETFEDTAGTAYRAPAPALSLLFAMQAQGGETQAKYYTDDAPIADVDETLSEAKFTGYVELSENVLSGDYYVLYYGGKSMSAAFIGNAPRVVTGDEAFQQACEEVGIYEVRSVDLDVLDVPAPASDADRPAGTGPDPTSVEPDVDTPPDAESAPDPAPTPDPEPASSPVDVDEAEPADPASDAAASASAAGDDVDSASVEGAGPPSADGERAPPTADPAAPATHIGDGADTSESAPTDHGEGPDPFSQEAAWRESRAIPALDPDQTDLPPNEPAPDESPAAAGEAASVVESAPADDRPSEPPADAGGERVEELETALRQRDDAVERLGAQLDEAAAERDALQAERDRLRHQLEQLRQADADASTATGAGLSREQALTQTDLFVRYGSKGKPTLETAHDGRGTREDVNGNLRIEEHTRFDAADATVDGEPFDAFLEETIEYRFVRWVVEDLLYEIQTTGSRRELRDLYDAIPRIDRTEFRGTVTARDEDGEELRQTFDVVVRDRMGQPLLVANINDARDPADDDEMSELVQSATAVGDSQDSLGAAFFVTASFFAPEALETASEATGGGLLNRETRKSYVKLTRKHGYHLCLVEARGREFHVAVPEL